MEIEKTYEVNGIDCDDEVEAMALVKKLLVNEDDEVEMTITTKTYGKPLRDRHNELEPNEIWREVEHKSFTLEDL